MTLALGSQTGTGPLPLMSGGGIHPRPQLARPGWTDLNGAWEFSTDDSDDGISLRWWQGDVPLDLSIVVPFPPESAASGLEIDGHAVVWYRRHASIDRPEGGRRVLLHFEGVDYVADVWVNGIHVSHHEGGQVGFHADITHALRRGADQIIVVRAFDETQSMEQPRGKQDWEAEPHVIWYRRTTGIWRQVWAETVSRTHIESLRWTPGQPPGTLSLQARIATARTDEDLDLEMTLSLNGARLARARHSVQGGQVSATIELRDPRFDSEPERLMWSPEHPMLIDVSARLIRHDEIIDDVTSYVGLRTLATDGNNFLLNGRPYYLRLVLEQAFWPDTHLASPSQDAIRDEVQLIKDLGFNGLRMHQVCADPRFLYWCDRLGLVVWADTAAAYRFSGLSLARTTREWIEILERDVSHPCVIAWVTFNESWGVPDLETSAAQQHAVRAMYHLLKALDPSRLVIGNDGWEFVVGDLLGVHDYTQSSRAIAERYGTATATSKTVASLRPGARRLFIGDLADAEAVPVVLSEFGGVSYTDADEAWSGYGAVDDQDAFVKRLSEAVGAVSGARGLAGFCYTQLTDTLQEANGLLTENRQPKADMSTIRAIIANLPAARG